MSLVSLYSSPSVGATILFWICYVKSRIMMIKHDMKKVLSYKKIEV